MHSNRFNENTTPAVTSSYRDLGHHERPGRHTPPAWVNGPPKLVAPNASRNGGVPRGPKPKTCFRGLYFCWLLAWSSPAPSGLAFDGLAREDVLHRVSACKPLGSLHSSRLRLNQARLEFGRSWRLHPLNRQRKRTSWSDPRECARAFATLTCDRRPAHEASSRGPAR
jgi:hypothetical protein